WSNSLHFLHSCRGTESAMPRWFLPVAFAVAAILPMTVNAQETVNSFPIPILGDRAGYSILPYLQEDAMIMHRSRGGFDAGNIHWAAGPRFVLGIPFADVNAFEFAYAGIYGLNGSAFE